MTERLTETDKRVDSLTGAESVMVPTRQVRPNLPDSGCPFCPGGLETPRDYRTLAIPNRWPAMPDDRCEVLLYTSVHNKAFWQLGTSQVLHVVDLWTDRSRVLGARPDVDYVLIFENRGRLSGTTIDHPHGQLYALAETPAEPLNELVNGYMPSPPPDLIVSEDRNWQAWVPEAAKWPFELLIATNDGSQRLSDAGMDRVGLANILVDCLARLDQVFDQPMPYMMWIHQRPFTDEAFAPMPLHIHIAGMLRSAHTQRFMAAAEVGGGLYFNTVDPALAARKLSDLAGHR